MELTVNLQFEQVLNLVRQLPKAELQRLVKTLQSQLSEMPEPKPLTDWQKLIQQAPTWGESELQAVEEARQHFNRLNEV